MAMGKLTYEMLFREALGCSPIESKELNEYSKDELIHLIHKLKEGIDQLNNVDKQEIQSRNIDFGLGILATTENDLRSFQEFCLNNFLPISKVNCSVLTTCNSMWIEHYLATGIDHFRTEYAMIVLLKNVEHNELSARSYSQEFSLEKKLYTFNLQIIVQAEDESLADLLTKIRHALLGELFHIDHDDHVSIPTIPAPKQPQFISVSSHAEIACWPLPRRRDLIRLRQDIGVTHILSLLNDREVNNTKICEHIKAAGIESLRVPIEGAEISIFTTSQSTIDVLIERLPAIRDLLFGNRTTPVKMLIHCAAGLHRTGTITYLLLRLGNFNADQALLAINRTRAITARQVGRRRIDAVEQCLLHRIP